MIDFKSNKYKTASSMIENYHSNGMDWDDIKCLKFYSGMDDVTKWQILGMTVNGITKEEWLEIVDNEKNEDEYGLPTSIYIPECTIPLANNYDYKLDESKGSAWSSYKRLLMQKGTFSKDAIHSIQTSAHKILNKLSLDTRSSGTIKGLVIGNVQSGKTANMAALMAMAADQGWNMFIVLSGTIENLRIQTQERLVNDLKSATNKVWIGLDNEVTTNVNSVHKLSQLSLNVGDNQRYLMVCLKNSTRLKNLLTWLRKDLKNRRNLKILVIDDEADQAGVNAISAKKAANATAEDMERTKINEAIVNLLNNKDENGDDVPTSYMAMDYVAFTATPYANILNERPGPKSTYPANFVASLSVSKNYFGPQQIFGIEGTDADGMDIVNKISIKELNDIKNICDGNDTILPDELKKAILWFYCCFATRKVMKIKKPVSMLIHTSQKQDHHDRMAKAIKKWIKSISSGVKFVELCKEVYNEQTSKFTLEKFHDQYSDYGIKDVQDYLPFEDIADTLVQIFNKGLRSIKIDENQDLKFSEGVHLCIDNCHHNMIENGDEHIRLIYPKDTDHVDYTTGYIVIGGATLSRGLTLEGLVSTYFLRTVKQADTLMQMGRWFGYRIGYELLQRVWMTEKTITQFEALSVLDYELRMEMKRMEENGISPGLVGIKIKQYPKNFLQLTSKNKTKDAILAEYDFSGIATQTTIFYEDEDKLEKNYKTTEALLDRLPSPSVIKNNVKASNCTIWQGIGNDMVIDYISSLEYPRSEATFLDPKLFKQWYKEIAEENGLKDWNVVLAGNESADDEAYSLIGKYKVSKVNRSKKKDDFDDGRIRIGALRAAKDLYVDIDTTNPNLSTEDIKDIKSSSTSKFRAIRKKAGMDKTSLLVIYVIDKDSMPREGQTKRAPMGTKSDVIGLFIVIPENDKSDKGEGYLSIRIPEESSIEEVDL